MKYFKKLALAVALAAAGTCSAATSFDEMAGTDITISSAGEYEFTGTWGAQNQDIWSFSLDAGLLFNEGGIVAFKYGKSGVSNPVFTGSFDGVNFTANGQVQLIAVPSLSTHTLVLDAPAATGAAYAGYFTVTAVPEPETYAMFLAGLGIMGALARRRKPA